MKIDQGRLVACAEALARQQEEADVLAYLPIVQCVLEADAKHARDLASAEKKAKAGRVPGQPVHNGPMICRHCGCTDARACDGGCYWAKPDLCSACEERGLK